MAASSFKPLENLEKPIPPKKPIYSLATNGRDLNEKELEAEEKAEKFSIKYYKRIHPVPGTLAFMYRNLEGGNIAIIEHLRNAIKTNNARFARNFITLWDKMDEFSKKRIDIFDILCDKYNVPRKKFWGVVQEGMFDYQEQITQTALGEYKLELVELLKKMAAKDRGQQDRRLLAEATKLVTNQPLVKVEDNSDRRSVTINNSPIPSFSRSISRANNNIRNFPPQPEARQLSEGNQDYIEGEIVNENEKELEFIRRAESSINIENQLEESIKEL